MSVVAEKRATSAVDAPWAARFLDWVGRERSWLAPSLVGAVNAVVFAVVVPNVNDLFAAVARESAALHGVGLSYWFSWYGGGATPGSYSILTPYLSAAIGAVPLAALASAAITPLTWVALRQARHPVLGVWVATFTAGMNLWSGRVPFALGCLLGVAATALLLRRRPWPAASCAVLAVAASPVAGAFVAIVLAGVYLSRPDWRPPCVRVAVPMLAAIAGATVLFGMTGPESFSLVQLLQLLATLALTLVAATPNWLRTSIWLTLVGGTVLFFVPNGLGDNLLRFAWYCLPAVIAATSARGSRLIALGLSAALVFCTKQTVGDVAEATEQAAAPAYYTSLVRELRTLSGPLHAYRLEVVDDGTHTGAFALLDYAMLARGYEYQEDNELNEVLNDRQLSATQYKVWLDNNAVGFVAIPRTHRKLTPEYALVSRHRPGYLVPQWADGKWALYRVRYPNPIVSRPVHVAAFSQSALVLRVPCACQFVVRIRKPEKLTATRVGTPHIHGRLHDDGFGWTMMTTPRPGIYRLSGN